MLYFILPPAIIVLSAALLTFFLFKKISNSPNEDLLRENENAGILHQKMNALPSATSRFFLRVLERIMHRFKLLSLKFHNTSNDWFHSIRKKREQSIMMHEEKIEKEREYNANLKIEEKQSEEVEEKVFTRNAQRSSQIKPLLRSDIMRSEKTNGSSDKKNQLEEVLIKRIAINPRDIEAYERLGDYYLEQANAKDSLECYRQVLKLSPAHYKAKSKIRRLEKMLP